VGYSSGLVDETRAPPGGRNVAGSGSERLTDAIPWKKYTDLPMDFADATLVSLAEELNTDLVFTVDKDFSVYRIRGRKTFRIVP